jgi:hypothetical protein
MFLRISTADVQTGTKITEESVDVAHFVIFTTNKNLVSAWPWPMSEERKKRETIDELTTLNERTQRPTHPTNPLLIAEGENSEKPRLGLLILESYGSFVPSFNPDKIFVQYIRFLVSRIADYLSFSNPDI